MWRFLLYLIIILGINVPNINYHSDNKEQNLICKTQQEEVQCNTPMKALDLVKKKYAANFDKIYETNSKDKYYYQLEHSQYYLAYEGDDEEGKAYYIHLYEFVIDDPDSGLGHTVTYGWFTVKRENGAITAKLY
jgi:hypothetical protein